MKSATKPFAPFEWMLAGRYLRTRRREGFVSVIAGFSFLGIMLGVATLIVVLSVMNGFRKELLEKIVGINGHVFIAPIDAPLTDYADIAERLSKVAGIRRAVPFVEGQAFASSPYNGSGVLVRGVRGSDLAQIAPVAGNVRQGSLQNFDASGGVALGNVLPVGQRRFQRLHQQMPVQAEDLVQQFLAKAVHDSHHDDQRRDAEHDAEERKAGNDGNETFLAARAQVTSGQQPFEGRKRRGSGCLVHGLIHYSIIP